MIDALSGADLNLEVLKKLACLFGFWRLSLASNIALTSEKLINDDDAVKSIECLKLFLLLSRAFCWKNDLEYYDKLIEVA